MTTEQRRALADTIPTTEVIKDAVTFPRDRLGEPLDISGDRFDAWLTRVRRDAAREALDGLAAELMETARDCALGGDHRGAGAWRNASAYTHHRRDTHYPEGDDQ